MLLAPTFDDSGRFDPSYLDDSVTDLPIVFERTDDGETRTKPCAEVLLGRRAADRIEQAGLMPILSVRDQGIVRLARPGLDRRARRAAGVPVNGLAAAHESRGGE